MSKRLGMSANVNLRVVYTHTYIPGGNNRNTVMGDEQMSGDETIMQ